MWTANSFFTIDFIISLITSNICEDCMVKIFVYNNSCYPLNLTITNKSSGTNYILLKYNSSIRQSSHLI